MGEEEKAVALFKQSNPRGIHNDFIGCILGEAGGSPEEAVLYLSRALLRCTASLTRVVIGYFKVYFRQGDFPAAAEILQLGLRFFSDLKKPGQTSFLDKTSTEFYVYLAAAQDRLGDTEGARESLRAAKTLAVRFDRASDYSGDSIRFVSAGRPVTAFDDMGETAAECMAGLLETYKSETLTALWNELAAEDREHDQ